MRKQDRRLKASLLQGWGDYSSENPDGPPTFLRDASECPGPLQVSLTLYKSGKKPDPGEADLIDMARELGGSHGFGDLKGVTGGECAFGIYGTCIFASSEYPRAQFWYLSNGYDFILATHLCPEEPDPVEVREADEIVMALRTGPPEKPWWKLW